MTPTTRRTLGAILPVALAIGVFGTVYGTLARPLMGVPVTLLTSATIFSGALQFTVAGLLLAGAGPAALLAAGVTLNVRHILLGALLRPRLRAGRLRRAVLSWFLVDETVGLALAEEEDPDATLLLSGIVCYMAWQLGTAVGVLGSTLDVLQDAAAAVFPVLFVGLAAVSATRTHLAVRAVAAGAVTLALAIAVPDARSLLPVGVALAAALPGSGEE